MGFCVDVFCLSNNEGKKKCTNLQCGWICCAGCSWAELWSAHYDVSSPLWCASTANHAYSRAWTKLHGRSKQSGLKKHIPKQTKTNKKKVFKEKGKCQKWIRDWLCVQLFGRDNEEIILARGRGGGRGCQACTDRVGFCSFLTWLCFRQQSLAASALPSCS